ncbi:MAG: hypothetical protein HEEMFOPI_01089 [Holosporales bacterium]
MNRYIVNVIFSQIIMSSLFATTMTAQNNLDAQERILDLKIKRLEATTAKMKKIFSDPNLTEAYYDRLIKELETLKALMNPKSTRTEEQLAALTDFEQSIVARAAQYGIHLGNTPVAPTAPRKSIQAPVVRLPSVTPNVVQHNPLPQITPNIVEQNPLSPVTANQSGMLMQQPMPDQMPSQTGVPYPLNMNDQQHYGPTNNDYQQNYNNPQQYANWDQQQYPNMIQGNNEMYQSNNNGMYQDNPYQQNALLSAPTDMVPYSNNAPVTSAQAQQPDYWSPSEDSSPQLLISRTRTARNQTPTDSEQDSSTVTPSMLRSMSDRSGNDDSVESLMTSKRNARGTNSTSDITWNDLRRR